MEAPEVLHLFLLLAAEEVVDAILLELGMLAETANGFLEITQSEGKPSADQQLVLLDQMELQWDRTSTQEAAVVVAQATPQAMVAPAEMADSMAVEEAAVAAAGGIPAQADSHTLLVLAGLEPTESSL